MRVSHGREITMPRPSTSSQVWRNGLIFGVIIAVISLANTFLSWSLGAYNMNYDATTGVPTTGAGPSTTLLGCGVFLVNLALIFVAGMLTARATGSVGAASLTGLVAGLLGAVVGGVVSAILVVTVIAPQIQIPSDSGISQSQIQGIFIAAAIGGAILGLLIDAGVGAGVAALGGLVGRGSYEKANPPQPYQQSFYPGAPAGAAPYPGQPYPGQPYPAQPYPGQPYPGQPTPQYPAPPPMVMPLDPSMKPPMAPPQEPPQQG
jgi:hypothetical protein